MRVLQIFFATLWCIGYLGNGLLFIYIQWSYLRQGWIQIFNPFLHIQVVITLLTTPLFWIFLMMAILGKYLADSIEARINAKNKKIATGNSGSFASSSTSFKKDKNSRRDHPETYDTPNKNSPLKTPKKDGKRPNSFQKSSHDDLIKWAIESSQAIRFDYENRNGNKSSRVVTPINLKAIGETYLESYCHLRKARRMFAIRRMRNIRIVSPGEMTWQEPSSSLDIASESSENALKTTNRPYMKSRVNELEGIVDSAWENTKILADIHYELGFRARRRAHRLRDRIARRLAQLQDGQFFWPTTTANIGLQNLSSDAFKYGEGLLRQCGYKVGMNGLSQRERSEILDAVFLCPLPKIEDRAYLEQWGNPKTSRRLQKMAESIAAFTRNARRHNSKDFSKAIQDWEADLVYLKEKYYNNHFSFRWPQV
ncbi:MAG: hypothetical protein DCF17_19810 [Shackletoniella antarctica]|uniref:WYL domain-containing protein n=1 Tax=Shackletoniella antarctica TaxID=268115 RepID=A0A2W4VYU5_9CYAN|nr:MAG: hypothetical protein DCF17_19810 [Shackletoniella antarctica]